MQSTASLLFVLLSFSPVETGLVEADCQTVGVLLCLHCLVLPVYSACQTTEIKLYWNTHILVCRGMCSALRQTLSGSVCVAIKT